MHIPEMHDYASAPHAEVAKAYLSQGRKKSIQTEIEEILSEEYDRLEAYATDHISEVAAMRAEAYIEALLNGNNDAANKLFDGQTDRHKSSGYDEGSPWARLIHGRIFETDGIKLRRKIVEAHTDLLKSERIKDLESIVEGLTKQVRETESELEALRVRFQDS